jgi:hypothetical protein
MLEKKRLRELESEFEVKISRLTVWNGRRAWSLAPAKSDIVRYSAPQPARMKHESDDGFRR